MLMAMASSRSRAVQAAAAVTVLACVAAGCTSSPDDSGDETTNSGRPLASLPSFPSQPTAVPTAPTLTGSALAPAPPTGSGLPSGAVTVALRSGALGTGCVPGAVERGAEAEAVAEAVADAVAAGGVTVATGEPASALGAGKSALLPPAGTVPPCPTPWVDVVHAVSVTSAPASAAHRLERMRTA
jgi:hypothetical protein